MDGYRRDLRTRHHERPADLDRRDSSGPRWQGPGTIARARNGGSAWRGRHGIRGRLPRSAQRRGAEVRQAIDDGQLQMVGRRDALADLVLQLRRPAGDLLGLSASRA